MLTPRAREIAMTPALRLAAVGWLLEWPNIDRHDLEDVLAEYSDTEILLTVNHYYDGGWAAFERAERAAA